MFYRYAIASPQRYSIKFHPQACFELLFVQPGKPTQNAFIESFNSRVRDELLQANRYRTIFEVCDGAEAWRCSYNGVHPHSSLGGMTPEEFLALYEITQPPQNSLAA